MPTLDDYQKAAISYYKQGKYAECVNICNQAIQNNFCSGPIFNIKSLALMGLKQYEEALTAINEAVLLSPQNETYLKNQIKIEEYIKKIKIDMDIEHPKDNNISVKRVDTPHEQQLTEIVQYSMNIIKGIFGISTLLLEMLNKGLSNEKDRKRILVGGIIIVFVLVIFPKVFPTNIYRYSPPTSLPIHEEYITPIPTSPIETTTTTGKITNIIPNPTATFPPRSISLPQNLIIDGYLSTPASHFNTLTFYVKAIGSGVNETISSTLVKFYYATGNAGPSVMSFDNNGMLNSGYRTKICLYGLPTTGPGSTFTLKMVPPTGGATIVQRTLPSNFEGGIIF
jgi:hypothetical protein